MSAAKTSRIEDLDVSRWEDEGGAVPSHPEADPVPMFSALAWELTRRAGTWANSAGHVKAWLYLENGNQITGYGVTDTAARVQLAVALDRWAS